MRIAFLGTSAFAAGVLSALAESAHAPALVITRPDRPRGRGRRTACPPVAERGGELGLDVYQPQSVNSEEAIERLDEIEPESVVICAFGALIKEPLLSRHPMLNLHPSLLPRWRGAAPIERALMAGDEQTGVCVMRLTAGLDSGPVCARASEPIEPEDDYGTLAERLCAAGGRLIVETLEKIEAGEPPAFQEQDEAGASYAEKIGPEDRLLDPARPVRELERIVRALHPHIGARVQRADGAMIGVAKARAIDRQEPLGEAAPAGRLAAVEGRLLLSTCDGALELLEVQPPGGRTMDAGAYLRGHAV